MKTWVIATRVKNAVRMHALPASGEFAIEIIRDTKTN